MKLRKILIVGGILLVAAIVYPIIRHFQLRAATESYIAELKAKGEPMELAQVIPPPLPSDQNSADTFRKVAALFKVDQSLLSTNSYFSCMKMVAPGRAMICSRQPEPRDSDATNSWEELNSGLLRNRESFELLQQLIKKPTFDFGVAYKQGFTQLKFENLYLPQSKQAALRLEMAVLNDLHRQDDDAAVRDLRAMLGIAKAMRREQLIISELVRIAIANIALTANWEILQSSNINDQQLAALSSDWSSLDFIESEEKALEVERAVGQIDAQNFRTSGKELSDYLNAWRDLGDDKSEQTALDRLKMEFRILRWRYWWSYPDELTALKGYQILLAAPRSAETNYSLLPERRELEAELAKLPIPTKSNESLLPWGPNTDLHWLLSDSIPNLSSTFGHVMKMEGAKQLVISAIAIKRYQLKYGKYPPELKSLTPEFLSVVPTDPIDGKPLRYRLNLDGTFLLYSIGDDGKDDSGDPAAPGSSKSPWWLNGRDWVWPQPATTEEIRKFYENPPK